MISGRERLDLSQNMLAIIAEVDIPFICRVENLDFSCFGRPKSMSMDKLRRVAGVLEMEPDEIVPPEAIGVVVPAKFVSIQECDPLRLSSFANKAFNPIDGAERAMLKDKLEHVLNSLHPIERDIIRARFALNDKNRTYTLDECVILFKRSRERIRQIESKALRKLQHPVRSRQLYHFDNPNVPSRLELLTWVQSKSMTKAVEDALMAQSNEFLDAHQIKTIRDAVEQVV
jgi:hypothetical protein